MEQLFCRTARWGAPNIIITRGLHIIICEPYHHYPPMGSVSLLMSHAIITRGIHIIICEPYHHCLKSHTRKRGSHWIIGLFFKSSHNCGLLCHPYFVRLDKSFVIEFFFIFAGFSVSPPHQLNTSATLEIIPGKELNGAKNMMQSEKSHHKRQFNHLHSLITQKYIFFYC